MMVQKRGRSDVFWLQHVWPRVNEGDITMIYVHSGLFEWRWPMTSLSFFTCGTFPLKWQYAGDLPKMMEHECLGSLCFILAVKTQLRKPWCIISCMSFLINLINTYFNEFCAHPPKTNMKPKITHFEKEKRLQITKLLGSSRSFAGV